MDDLNYYLKILNAIGGYYVCPKDSDGRRLGPLVGYAGDYTADDGVKKKFVGDIYVNFGKAEEQPRFLAEIASDLKTKLKARLPGIDAFCGAPLGGYSLASMLGYFCDRRVMKAEKKVTAVETATDREKSILIFGRHMPAVYEKIAIIEDVCNNFSTTEKHIELIERNHGIVKAIVCFFNRSLHFDDTYTVPSTGKKIPVVSLVHRPYPEYKQDDAYVLEDIAKNNVIWKPKDHWDELENAMLEG